MGSVNTVHLHSTVRVECNIVNVFSALREREGTLCYLKKSDIKFKLS